LTAKDKPIGAFHRLEARAVLEMEPKLMELSVRLPSISSSSSSSSTNSSDLLVSLAPSDTTDQLKAKIAEASGIDVDRLIVKFQDNELPRQGRTVKDMGLYSRDDNNNNSNDDIFLQVEYVKILVTLRILTGDHLSRTLKVSIDPAETLPLVQEQLEREAGLEENDISHGLFFKGEELPHDDRTAAAHGIKAGSVLDLEREFVIMRATAPDGSQHSLRIRPRDTVAAIRDAIAQDCGYGVQRQILKTHQGKPFVPKETDMVKDMTDALQNGLSVELLKIPITVMTLHGRVLELNVEPSATVSTVKTSIAREWGWDEKRRQRLRIEKRDVLADDEATLEESGVTARNTLTVELVMDNIIFVDIKCGTLFAVDREVALKKGVLTVVKDDDDDVGTTTTTKEEEEKETTTKPSFFKEAIPENDVEAKEKLLKMMKDSPTLGVHTQKVVVSTQVEEYKLAEAEKVSQLWGVQLRGWKRNRKGEEFLFVDPKTRSTGELIRRKMVDTKFITPVPASGKESETIAEREMNIMDYEGYIMDIRGVFGVKSHD